MDCSGERFVPQQADPFDEIAVEHQQRYHAIKSLVRGKTVLDAGSGEGYGTHLLAQTADHATGLDISQEAIDNARVTYARPNLDYRVGSVDALPFDQASLDVVVSFEVIEHLDEVLQAAFLREVRRVLKDRGILIISTPNKAVYSDHANQHNRFHKKEFYLDEFTSFLGQYFPRIALFGQSWSLSSILYKPNSRHLENLRPSDQVAFSPKYVVAVCGSTDSVNEVDLSSIIIDPQGKLEKMWERIVGLQGEVEGRNSWVFSLENDLGEMRKRVSELQNEVEEKNSWVVSLENDLGEMRKRVAELQNEVEEKNSWVTSVRQEIERTQKALAHYKNEAAEFEARLIKAHQHIAGLDERIQAQQETISDLEYKVAELNRLRTEFDLVKQSNFWKVASRYWRLRDSLLPLGSRRRRLLNRALASLKTRVQDPSHTIHAKPSRSSPETTDTQPNGNVSATDPSGSAFEVIEFTKADAPMVSIIVPVFNQWAYTYRCMKSIHRTMAGLPCEVILADDSSTDTTTRAEQFLIGVRVLRAGENRGFLRNCNFAAGQTKAPYLFFLNNDTELQHGTVQALVSLMERDATIGMAGSKLVYPDGRLQEAGGIIWNDAGGWNFGRNEDPGLPAYNYVKEVDYVSGASMMIRKELWDQIGGFDERFAPAYCEDSDLAFEVRKRGFKVVYQPQSVVVHFEGASHGTDVSRNMKAYQAKNMEVLRAKWAKELALQFPNGSDIFHARDRSAGRKTILMIDHYVPHFDRDAGSRTIWSFIQAFLKMGINVKFLGDNFFPHQPYTDALQQAGVEVLTGPWFADRWPEWLEENGRSIDYVFLNRPHIAPKYLLPVRAHTKARVFYYVHDLHYLRELKLAELARDSAARMRAERSRSEEQRLMSQMDVIFSCSDAETRIIRDLCPAVAVHHVPPYSMDVDLEWEFDQEKRQGLLFVGGFSHPPNADGVLWFIHEIWPTLKDSLPGVVFSIAGSEPPSEVLALASDDVKVLGFVSDARLNELYRSTRLVVIPLRYGAGVKGKTVEAMAHGVPFVSTEWGVEGMPGVQEFLDPMQYRQPLADAIVSLYADARRLQEISKKERAYVSRHFTIEKIQEVFALVMTAQA